MPGEDSFKVEGRIIGVLSDRTYSVELPNGHRLLGYLTAKGKLSCPCGLELNDTVKLQLSPFDLSEGRILGKKE